MSESINTGKVVFNQIQPCHKNAHRALHCNSSSFASNGVAVLSFAPCARYS